MTKDKIKKIALELNQTKTPKELSVELGESVSLICQVARRLRLKGVKIPRKNVYGNIEAVVTELKIERPELFKND